MDERGTYTRKEINNSIILVAEQLLYKYFGNDAKANVIDEMELMLKEQFDIIE